MKITGFLSSLTLVSSVGVVSLLACGTQEQSAHASSVSEKSVRQVAAKTADLPVFETTPAQVEATQNAVLAKANDAIHKLVSQEASHVTFDSTFVELDRIVDEVNSAMGRLAVIENTAVDEALRTKAQAAGQELTKWNIGLSFREDVYQVLRAFADKPAAKRLRGADKRFVDLTLLDFERSGLKLDAEKRAHLQKLNEQLAVDTSDIASNIVKDRGDVKLTEAEMEGVPEDIRARLRQPDSSYLVKTSIHNDYAAIMENAAREDVRKKVLLVSYSRAKETNRSLINRTLRTRAEIAQLLGYNSWGDFQTAPRMAGTAKTVIDFLTSLSAKIDPKFQAERAELAALKGSPLNLWDVNYYLKQLNEKKYNVDSEVLRNYFAMDKVLDGMFRTYEKVMGIEIKEVPAPYKWVPDLRLFAIYDKGGREPLGYVYMDLFPRDGKYGHFASFGITSGMRLPNGTYRKPVSALICNFPAPEAGKPSLLSHNDVTTIFHEFGHSMHTTLTQARYSRMSGTNVPNDFVEAPSQLFERWAWNPDVLDTFAVHYQHPGEKLPRDVLQKMNEARLGTVAHQYKRQLTFGFMDMKLHEYANPAQIPEDPYALSNAAFESIYYPVPEGTAFLATFGHLFGGYDAGYYGYAWSDAITADLATAFENAKGHFLDTRVGHRLRKEIYEVGNSRDPNESIKKFLGRSWNDAAFAKYLGVNAVTNGN